MKGNTMSKRARMLKRNKDRRETECRGILSELFTPEEIVSLSPGDAVTLGMQYRRELDAERKERAKERAREDRREEVQKAKDRRDADKYRRECREKKLQGVS